MAKVYMRTLSSLSLFYLYFVQLFVLGFVILDNSQKLVKPKIKEMKDCRCIPFPGLCAPMIIATLEILPYFFSTVPGC